MRAEVARRLLGVDAGASVAEVDSAYRQAARSAHPDVGGDAARFAELTAARGALTRSVAAGARVVPALVVRHDRRRRVLHAVLARLPSAPPPRVR